ncbi:MAG: non-canonical purine NTP pyrophosphatase [Candidatus Spechtbacterales bacterium]|nr:non-canonical purine NTP pyrophosphatase [Candidatus Spechtbacterales bacterium]
MLHFITGNTKKFKEVEAMLKGIVELKQLDIDLPEIQDDDPKNIVKEKLIAAKEHHEGKFIVDDASLGFECLNGLPGPLIKWFLEAMGPEGLYDITKNFDNHNATARTTIGYFDGEEIYYFEGEVEGKIVEKATDDGFGWDVIFKPNIIDVTYAELSLEQKNEISHRRKAIEKLKEFLKEQK